MAFAEIHRLTLLFCVFAGVFAFPLVDFRPSSITTVTPLSPIPIPYSLLGPPKPVRPVDPGTVPNLIPPPVEPVCPPTLGKPTPSDCLAAAAAIPRDPRGTQVLRNFYVRESDRSLSMENVALPYEKTVG